jgi:hypothetical protein
MLHITSYETTTILLLIVVPGLCKNADWKTSFDSIGWSKCPSSFPYINGLYRSATVLFQDGIFRIESASCCEGFGNITSECVEVDWRESFTK